jgi:hypothetical protein
VSGTTDAAEIQLQIEQDKNKLEQFRIKMEAASKDEQAYFTDVQSARAQTIALAQVQSSIAFGAPGDRVRREGRTASCFERSHHSGSEDSNRGTGQENN